MLRPAACLLAAALAASQALANVPPPPEVVYLSNMQDMLAGGWRFQPDGERPAACDQPMKEGGQILTFEFATTGGQLRWTTQGGDDVVIAVRPSVGDDGIVRLTSKDGDLAFDVSNISGKVIDGAAMADSAAELQGKTFLKCYEPADRAKIRLEHYGLYSPPLGLGAMAYLSQGGQWAPPRFVDTRFEKKGVDLCHEPEAQYLYFDLVGPLGFSMGRWNSGALAEKLADGGKSAIAPDEVANWTVEEAGIVEGGWTFKVTELIPPNGSRGDTTTFTLLAKDDTVTIPEWKRSYRRCTEGEETTEVPE